MYTKSNIITAIVVFSFILWAMFSVDDNQDLDSGLQQPDYAYELDGWGSNPDVYEFTPKSNPNWACIVVGETPRGSTCFPKAEVKPEPESIPKDKVTIHKESKIKLTDNEINDIRETASKLSKKLLINDLKFEVYHLKLLPIDIYQDNVVVQRATFGRSENDTDSITATIVIQYSKEHSFIKTHYIVSSEY